MAERPTIGRQPDTATQIFGVSVLGLLAAFLLMAVAHFIYTVGVGDGQRTAISNVERWCNNSEAAPKIDISCRELAEVLVTLPPKKK